MADYHTLASVIFPVGSAENATAAMAIYQKMNDEAYDADDFVGFDASIQSDDPTALWIRHDESITPEHVVNFAMRCAKELGLKGRWGFEWTNTCSRPRTDAYGGGAVMCNFDTGRARWMNTGRWLDNAMNPRPRSTSKTRTKQEAR